MNYIVLQGTKVLGDREVRADFTLTERDRPPPRVSAPITKYTGTAISPEWTDDEPGRVFAFPSHLVESAQSQADKFETLCYVEADISSAPYSSKKAMGKTGYKRGYDVILLVGLTELKAQICCKDAAVRVHIVYVIHPAHGFHVGI